VNSHYSHVHLTELDCPSVKRLTETSTKVLNIWPNLYKGFRSRKFQRNESVHLHIKITSRLKFEQSFDSSLEMDSCEDCTRPLDGPGFLEFLNEKNPETRAFRSGTLFVAGQACVQNCCLNDCCGSVSSVRRFLADVTCIASNTVDSRLCAQTCVFPIHFVQYVTW
jgi:hypothetical protein